MRGEGPYPKKDIKVDPVHWKGKKWKGWIQVLEKLG